MVIVPKKGGKWKIYIDYRALNRVTRKNKQPFFFIDVLLDQVADHQMYTFYNGYGRYHQRHRYSQDYFHNPIKY